MANKSLKFLSKLPQRYRSAADPQYGWTDDKPSCGTSRRSYSWRTFSTSSAPSELLSFYRDVHLYTVGRALNRLGKLVADPIDDFMARRELRRLLQYLESLETEEDWETAKRVLQSRGNLSGLLEAGRPMYPLDIRLLAHCLVFYAVVCCDCSLGSILDPKLEFATRNEYIQWLREQASVQAFILNRHNPGYHRNLSLSEIPWFTGATDQISTDLIETVKTVPMASRAGNKQEQPSISIEALRQMAVERVTPTSRSLEHLSRLLPSRYRSVAIHGFRVTFESSTLPSVFNLIRPVLRFITMKIKQAGDAPPTLSRLSRLVMSLGISSDGWRQKWIGKKPGSQFILETFLMASWMAESKY
jgi:hypothetical protein